MGSLRVGHDWATSLSLSLSCIGEGNGNPLQFLAWRIPGMGKPGGLPSTGLHRVGHDWSDLAAAAAAACMYIYREKQNNLSENGGHLWISRGSANCILKRPKYKLSWESVTVHKRVSLGAFWLEFFGVGKLEASYLETRLWALIELRSLGAYFIFTLNG